MCKPKLNILGKDGNAFFILGTAKRAAKRAGWSVEKINTFLDEAKSNDYDHLLQTCNKLFDIN